MAPTRSRRRHGEGSIYQRARDKKWCAVIDLGRVNGKRRRVTLTGATHKEVLAKMRKAQAAAEEGVLPVRLTVEVWMRHWLTQIAPDKIKPSTLAMYTRYAERYIIPTVGRYQLTKLSADHIRNMQTGMKELGLSPATIRQANAILQSALQVAVKERRITYNAAQVTGAPTAKLNPHPILSADDARRVLHGAQDERELCRLVCALVLGLRQGEALGLRWEDVLLSGEIGTVSIVRTIGRVKGQGLVEGTPKSDSSTRQVPLIPDAAAAFAVWRQMSGGRGWVFHGHAGPQAPESPERDHRAWKAALARAGVPLVPLHGARGSAATLLQQLGVPERVIADIVGHANVRITNAHYLHSDEAQRRAALESLGAALQLTSGSATRTVALE